MEAAVQVPPRIDQHRKPVIGTAVAYAAILGVGIILFLFNPSEHGFYPFCLFNRMTGLLCPGCGGLRAGHELLHGNIPAAFQLNPLVVLAVPLLGFILARALWRKRVGKYSANSPSPTALWVALAVLLLFGILRNVPTLREAGLVF